MEANFGRRLDHEPRKSPNPILVPETQSYHPVSNKMALIGLGVSVGTFALALAINQIPPWVVSVGAAAGLALSVSDRIHLR